ncbi:MAG: DEAD/DEAH box helicase family protein [Culicoidibacterales bacterium]
MGNITKIQAVKPIFPQIYAYTLLKEKSGWVKIGYTERKNVEIRIKEQIKTVNLAYNFLWSAPAKFKNSEKWFKDYDFHAYLTKFKNIDREEKAEWFYYNDTPELSYNHFLDFINHKYDQASGSTKYFLRSEQQLAVQKTLEYFNSNENSEFLWNAKPRFGKTLTTYDLAIKLQATNVLVVTNRPAIANSWFDDFEKFIAWQTDFEFVSTSDSLKERKVLSREEFLENIKENSKQIAFVSLQDLKGAISFGGNYDKLGWVKNLEWDLLVIDEAHEGVDTLKTDIAFDNIKRKWTLHLSGTPFKAVASGKFKEEQIYNWTYADEQTAKIEWNNEEENNPYRTLPKLNLFSYQMSQMITDEVNKGAQIGEKAIDYAFDLNEFFGTNHKDKFKYESDVIKWLNTLTSNEKYPFSTSELRAELKHTFWLLNRVASAKALKKLLEKHPVFENYQIILAAGDGKSDDDQVNNQKALARVKEAIKNSKKTITLSVKQLTTGVTIPEWTAVLMLSNMKSPSLYMQAAFRAQNPWQYEENGQFFTKDQAYVFDFAPERTLMMYDEFANNLSSQTSNAGGTRYDRKENIQQLLNFFPVIAEDSEGKMTALDADQVLTLPTMVKAREVVKSGFMSNFVFQNVYGIFASSDAREILEQLNPVAKGKVIPKTTGEPINTRNVTVDDNGDVVVNPELVITETEARFGEKMYADVTEKLTTINSADGKLSSILSETFKENVNSSIQQLAKENDVTDIQAQQIVEKNVAVLEREIEKLEQQAEIKLKEIEKVFEKQIAEANCDNLKITEAKLSYEKHQQQIEDELKQNALETVQTLVPEITEKTTEKVLEKSAEKRKATVEEDVRARLRGFSRTIPAFLMAYGCEDTELQNFDSRISDDVFKETTGITLEQFRTLRDTYNFFDEVVFNESIQEFLRKRAELANYFDDSQSEDIFDYIPPQQTNQIFTPKKVVKMMIDKLVDEDPEVFSDPNKTFADLYMKSGLYITEIVKRLYIGLEKEIPNSEQRLKHILENQVYGFAPTEIIYNIARNFIFGCISDLTTIDDSHIVYLDTTPYAKGEASMSFEEKCDQLFSRKDQTT